MSADVEHSTAAQSAVRQAYDSWWRSACDIHDVLETLDPHPATVTERFEAEYRTRRDYAIELRRAGRDVPEYLAADQSFPSRWPVPPPPA